MDAHALRQSALTLIAVACATAACAPSASAPPPRAAPPASAEAREALPFLHDDWPRAAAEAKRTKRLVFVDAWAPWCHSCQSMRAFVFTDRSLAPLANDFVWLTIDTEKDENAAFVGRFPNAVWPTLWVLDPERQEPVLRWEGTATAAELRTLLAAATGGDPTTVTFLRATHEAARGELDAAKKDYEEVIRAADHPERARAVEGLVSLLSSRKDFGACAELALAEAPRLGPGTSRATALAIGLSCAREAKRGDDGARLAEAAERAANDPDPRTAADDRSALFEELVETKKEAGDAAARRIAEAWAGFLEAEAARAPTKQARAVFDAHRLEAYLALGDPARALPMLGQSERDFPDDYNPPARLARAYLELRRLDEARAAIDRAAARVYGPRALRVFALAADIAQARGDREGERAALGEALRRTERAALNEPQKKLRAKLEARLRGR